MTDTWQPGDPLWADHATSQCTRPMFQLVGDQGGWDGASWANTSTERSGGPERTKVGEEDPKFKPRPVGFTAAIEPVEVDPLTWDGDNA